VEQDVSDEETKAGRPSLYRPEFCQKAADLCANGATDAELAQSFEVSARTIYRWQNEHPEFSQALKAGKEVADERVIRSLYHKAIGYTFDAVKIFMPAGADGPVYAPYQEHVPPDTTAAIFWLKNRRAGDWRDKTEHVHRHEHVHELSDDELARIATGRSEGVAPQAKSTQKPH
jgi:hypothetical protein